MKHLGRWLFNFTAAVSVMLCVGALIAWPISYRHRIEIERDGYAAIHLLFVNRGRIHLGICLAGRQLQRQRITGGAPTHHNLNFRYLELVESTVGSML